MARDEAFCGELLGVLLQDPKLEVVECEPQSAVTNPQGRSVVLDALCELSGGRFVDVEAQRTDRDGSRGRSRGSCGRTPSRKAMGLLGCPEPEEDVRASYAVLVQ